MGQGAGAQFIKGKISALIEVALPKFCFPCEFSVCLVHYISLFSSMKSSVGILFEIAFNL